MFYFGQSAQDFSKWQKVGLYTALFLCAILVIISMLATTPLLLARALLILSTALLSALLVVPAVIRLAYLARAVDLPGGRRIHVQPTPRWGGLALGFAVMLALTVFAGYYMPNLKALLSGALFLLVVGAIDDARPLPAALKLCAQLAATLLLICDGVVIKIFPPVWWGIPLRWAITFFWVVGLTNAINFLDGMDGLLSGWVITVCLIFGTLAFFLEQPMLMYASAALLGATLGFLVFNLKPARLFLGDGGSTFLGFLLAALSVQGDWSEGNPLVSFSVPVLVMSVPIYDMVFTTVERIYTGKVRSFRQWLEYTGRDHLHHRLETLGLSRGQVVKTICFLTLTVGLSAVVLYRSDTFTTLVLLVQTACIYGVFALLELLGRKKALLEPPTKTS